jgi:sigma-B regulation protein RsbU (phosphoserine phosphatase)
METAKEIQQSFLPEAPPSIEGFEIAALTLPAEQVGGDFYDFIPISSDRWGMVIADVSGKGVPAALFMGLSQALIRAGTADNSTPVHTVQKANDLLINEARSSMFVTVLYAALDSKGKVLHYVNAGHNPPLVFKGGTGEIILLRTRGIALGVMDDIEFEEKQLKLESNDMLVMYTDGVTEAVNKAQEEFGTERLQQMLLKNNNLTARDFMEKLKNEVLAFSEGQPQFDDITLVVLKVT